MTDLGRGQRVSLPDLGPSAVVDVGIDVSSAQNLGFDICCFGVDAEEHLVADEWLVFYNNPASPGNAVRSVGPHDGDEQVFQVDLAAVPEDVARLVFTVSLDGEATMAAIAKGHIRVVAGGNQLLRFGYYGADFTTEESVVVGELYRRDGWRFAAVGQGYEGGLATLVAAFGGEVLDDEAPAAAPPPAPVELVDEAPPPVAVPDAVPEPEPQPEPVAVPAASAPDRPEPSWVIPGVDPRRLEYKVLSQKDSFFKGRMDPEGLSDAIMSFTSMGWEVVGQVKDNRGGSRDDIIMVLAREY